MNTLIRCRPLGQTLAYIVLCILLATLLPANGLHAYVRTYYPDIYYGIINHLNNLPGSELIIGTSTLHYQGKLIHFGFYNILFFKVVTFFLFAWPCLILARALKIPFHDIGLTLSFGKNGALDSLKVVAIATIVLLGFFALVVFSFSLMGIKFHIVRIEHWWPFNIDDYAGLIMPLTEELLFRGVIFAGLLRHFSAKSVLISSSIFFGLMHLYPNGWIKVVFATILGLYLGWIYYRTRSLIVSTLVHISINAIGIFMYIQLKVPKELLKFFNFIS